MIFIVVELRFLQIKHLTANRVEVTEVAKKKPPAFTFIAGGLTWIILLKNQY